MSKRVLLVGLGVIAVLVGVIAVLYVYGAPTPGTTVAATQQQLDAGAVAQAPVDAGQAPVVDSPGAPDAAKPDVPKVTADAKAPEPDPNSPLAISIPGCKCHSDDPKLVKQHEGYRMNQCAGCHAGQTPTGQ